MNSVLFYIIVFITFCIISGISVASAEFTHLPIAIFIIIGGLIFTGLLALGVKHDMTQKDSFLFEVTPEKRCDMGPYMYSDNPEKQKFCSQFSPEDMAQYECSTGFHGRPVHMIVDNSTSDDNWQNHLCDKGQLNYQMPQVL
jgi:hypothetical protein